MTTANIGLEADIRKENCEILERTLSTEFVLNVKIRNYHWNVVGINFYEFHKFFEELYESSTESIDEIAEIARMLGYKVVGNMQEYIEKSIITEDTNKDVALEDMIQNLLEDKEEVIRQMRKDIDTVADTGDQLTEDFLTGEIRRHEKDAWMLRAMTK